MSAKRAARKLLLWVPATILAGCICATCVLWVRSYWIAEGIGWASGIGQNDGTWTRAQWRIFWQSGGVRIQRRENGPLNSPTSEPVEYFTTTDFGYPSLILAENDPDKIFDALGIQIVSTIPFTSHGIITREMYVIFPFWTVCLPTTILLALLLFRHRHLFRRRSRGFDVILDSKK